MEATKTKSSLKEACVLWRKTDKKGNHYFTGKGLVGFYVGEKQNPNEPDLRVYETTEEGRADFQKEVCSMWVNESHAGNTYLAGKFRGEKAIGFIEKEDTTDTKKPYLKVYFKDAVPSYTPNEQVEPEKVFAKEESKETKPVKTPGKKF